MSDLREKVAKAMFESARERYLHGFDIGVWDDLTGDGKEATLLDADAAIAAVAEALLSPEAVEAAAKSRGGYTDTGWEREAGMSPDYQDTLRRDARRDIEAALAALGFAQGTAKEG